MINWENIRKEIQENYDDNDSLLQYIKDEIGTCGECDKWSTQNKLSAFGNCFLNDDDWHSSDYCSKFERIKDD